MVPVLSGVRTAVIGRREALDLGLLAPVGGDKDAKATASRKIFHGDTWYEAPVYARDALGVGARIAGPCIVEQDDATTFMDPGSAACVDPLGNLIIEVGSIAETKEIGRGA